MTMLECRLWDYPPWILQLHRWFKVPNGCTLTEDGFKQSMLTSFNRHCFPLSATTGKSQHLPTCAQLPTVVGLLSIMIIQLEGASAGSQADERRVLKSYDINFIYLHMVSCWWAVIAFLVQTCWDNFGWTGSTPASSNSTVRWSFFIHGSLWIISTHVRPPRAWTSLLWAMDQLRRLQLIVCSLPYKLFHK